MCIVAVVVVVVVVVVVEVVLTIAVHQIGPSGERMIGFEFMETTAKRDDSSMRNKVRLFRSFSVVVKNDRPSTGAAALRTFDVTSVSRR